MEVLKYRVDGTSEWKDIIALQGKPGEKGEPFEYEDFTPEQLEMLKGKDGKTPVLGEDYFTETDKNEIKKYCDTYIDSQLGLINEELASLTTLGGE